MKNQDADQAFAEFMTEVDKTIKRNTENTLNSEIIGDVVNYRDLFNAGADANEVAQNVLEQLGFSFR